MGAQKVMLRKSEEGREQEETSHSTVWALVNTGGHFVAVQISCGNVAVYDSMHTVKKGRTAPLSSSHPALDLARLIRWKSAPIAPTKRTSTYLPGPKQDDGCSCGVYAAMYLAYAVATGRESIDATSWRPEHMPFMRIAIAHSILTSRKSE